MITVYYAKIQLKVLNFFIYFSDNTTIHNKVKIILILIRPSPQGFNILIRNQENKKSKLTQATLNR